MKSQTILIYKKIYLDLHQKAEVFIFHNFFFINKFKPSGFRADHFNNFLSCFVADVFHSRKVIRDFSPGVIFVCYYVN